MPNKFRPEANTEAYAYWRKKVRARDKSRCQMPNCGTRKSIQVHHIRKWASASSLRYDVDNGICLCRKCHKEVTGKEEHYEKLFYDIVYNGR